MKNYITIICLVIITVFTCSNIDIKEFGINKITNNGIIDLNNLDNYANQPVPNYITKDNTANNPITDVGATLGRVLFYDKNLSSNNTVSCASCHNQEFAFSDTAQASVGVNGTTGRHAMRLINARFADETKFFWDERAPTLEFQTTQPIQDHAEMGFSGTNGDPDLDSLIRKLSDLPYYEMLFKAAFGDATITENRMQLAMAQFIRSIQSFDSKFDVGFAQVNAFGQPFPNFTTNENAGKTLFLIAPQIDTNGVRIGGGLGCMACHRGPEFDIDPNSGNNGTIGSINGTGAGSLDFTNTRAPSLRDLENNNGILNGPLMHNGGINTIAGAIIHYNQIVNPPINTNLDPRLLTPGPNGVPLDLQMTTQERLQVLAFLRTLTGNNVYTDLKWSDPFDTNGDLQVLAYVNTNHVKEIAFKIYPTLTNDAITIETPIELNNEKMYIYNITGQLMYYGNMESRMNVGNYPAGMYIVKIGQTTQKFIKK